MRVVFVCSGNICRSPTGEVVLRRLAERAGVADAVEVSSAGTGGWHAGEEMDRRSRAELQAAGYAPGPHAARQFRAAEFDGADVVVALDRGHRDALRELAADTDDPAAARAKIVLLRAYDPEATANDDEVGDPYYGGAAGFRDVLEQVERSCRGLLVALVEGAGRQQTDRPPA